MRTLEELRAALRQKQEALADLKAKAFGEKATEADLDALKAHLDAIDKNEADIETAARLEATEARAAKPVEHVSAPPAVVSAPARPNGLSGEDIIVRAAAAQIISKGNGEPVLKILQDQGYGQIADLLGDVRVNGKAVNTLVSAEGGILVPTPASGGIMPLLNKQSTFIEAGPVRVPLTNGQFVLARGLAGATASYIAEGALKPVSTPTFDTITMRAKKLAGIVPITKEAQMWTIGDIEGYVRQDLRNALALTLDLNAYLGTGSGASPLGILNKAGVQTNTSTFGVPATPTLAELDSFATSMILKLTTNNIFANDRWRWLMPYRTAMRLADMRTSTGGDIAYPTMDIGRAGGPVWKGIPVIITSQIPTNGGAGTNETTIALVDFNHVLFGEEEGITVRMSDQATLNVDGGSTLVHLWQQNMFAILCEAMHDFGLRTAKAVVKQTAIVF